MEVEGRAIIPMCICISKIMQWTHKQWINSCLRAKEGPPDATGDQPQNQLPLSPSSILLSSQSSSSILLESDNGPLHTEHGRKSHLLSRYIYTIPLKPITAQGPARPGNRLRARLQHIHNQHSLDPRHRPPRKDPLPPREPAQTRADLHRPDERHPRRRPTTRHLPVRHRRRDAPG